MINKNLLIFGISGLLCATAQANEPPPYSATYAACSHKATSEMASLICIGDEHQRWDRRMNQAWQDTLKTRQNPKAWRQAQRNWIKFRDSQCDIYNFPGGGSGNKTAQEMCLLNMTLERARQLENSAWPGS